MKHRRAARIDTNQPQIVKDLRKMGFSAEPGHDDIIVGKRGLTLWVEIKNPDGGRLKSSQKKLLAEFKGAYLVAETTEEIVRWFDDNWDR